MDEKVFAWQVQPRAEKLVHGLVAEFCAKSHAARQLGDRMLRETGTRFVDSIDFLAPSPDALDRRAFIEAGFTLDELDGMPVVKHPGGMFPPIRLDGRNWRLGVKVESVADFLNVHGLNVHGLNVHGMNGANVEGAPNAALRMACIARHADAEMWVVERHGQLGFVPRDVPTAVASAIVRHAEAFRSRRRIFDREEEGFEHTLALINAAATDLGYGGACDLFFAAERTYWESRNRAGRLQKARQDRLGLGWGNHDHHTYRSSREHFASLIGAFEALGLFCRERFHAGVEAGWGAQVMEHPECPIVVFADVDLSPEEAGGDFAHSGLGPRTSRGTIGLWCSLHGEALLQAGMHHLEAQFDFDAARAQLAYEGVATMAPFTDFAHLRQAFTQGEVWEVEPSRIAMARAAGLITDEQAEQFAKEGALGSHLELLERNQGYKGFNQTGISQIIRRTDPRGEPVAA